MDGELAGGITAIGKLRVRPAAEIKQSGISVGWECLDREIFDPEKCYEPLAEAGVKWARCQTGWNRCETVKGQYDFAWLDDIVDKLLRRGVQPWFNIGYGNKLYMPDAFGDAAVGSVPLYFGEETQTAWTNFVGALAKHFSGRVKRWEIWNESDNRNFWQPREPNPAEYARFLRLTAPLIRAAIPDAEIGACVSVVFNNGYVAPFIQTGIGDTIDFFSVHGYRLQPELNYAREITALRRLFDANKGGHVRIFQGESGYPSWFPPQHWLGNYIMESEEN